MADQNKEPDMVNHPPHYKSHPSGIECIQIVEHMNFNCGNAVKYIWRNDEKGNPIQDLEKAKWYIQREIERLQKIEEFNNSTIQQSDILQHSGVTPDGTAQQFRAA